MILKLLVSVASCIKVQNDFVVKNGYIVLDLVNFEGRVMKVNSTINSIQEVKELAEI
jgi:hypothetical protein